MRERSGGAAKAQIYSSLVLQEVVPAPVRGRIFSFEQTITPVSNVGARILAGFAIDVWGWSIFQVDGLASLITVGVLIGWATYFALSRKHLAVAYGLAPATAGTA